MIRIRNIIINKYNIPLEISGKNDNDEHSLNILLILITLLVSHFEILGNDNDDHL